MKKILVTGGSGCLGSCLVKKLKGLDVIAYAPSSLEMDITNKDTVEKVVKTFQPDIIYHCAAYTAVDKAEEEKEKCYDINVNGTKYLKNICEEQLIKLIYISTDYVFDGTKIGLYKEEDSKNPINYYGYTKYLGEEITKELKEYLIIRISWVFGVNGKNFIKTMLKLGESKEKINVVCDQVGSPTYVDDLVEVLVNMIDKELCGIYHITNDGFCSWYEFAKYIFEINHISVKVNPILSKDYESKAKRPMNSRLSKEKIKNEQMIFMPDWKDATKRYCKVLKEVMK